jgi:hypothetical protein
MLPDLRMLPDTAVNIFQVMVPAPEILGLLHATEPATVVMVFSLCEQRECDGCNNVD